MGGALQDEGDHDAIRILNGPFTVSEYDAASIVMQHGHVEQGGYEDTRYVRNDKLEGVEPRVKLQGSRDCRDVLLAYREI
eukprot:5771202-Pyramimonas_sp.AAC.1